MDTVRKAVFFYHPRKGLAYLEGNRRHEELIALRPDYFQPLGVPAEANAKERLAELYRHRGVEVLAGQIEHGVVLLVGHSEVMKKSRAKLYAHLRKRVRALLPLPVIHTDEHGQTRVLEELA